MLKFGYLAARLQRKKDTIQVNIMFANYGDSKYSIVVSENLNLNL